MCHGGMEVPLQDSASTVGHGYSLLPGTAPGLCPSVSSDAGGRVCGKRVGLVVSAHLPFLFQLALSPSPRNPAEPIAVQSNQQLALKVEGVVQHGSKPGLFRRIQSVCLNVSSTLQSKSSQDYKVTHTRQRCAVFGHQAGHMLHAPPHGSGAHNLATPLNLGETVSQFSSLLGSVEHPSRDQYKFCGSAHSVAPICRAHSKSCVSLCL